MPLEVLLPREMNANFTPKLGLLLRPAGLTHDTLPPKLKSMTSIVMIHSTVLGRTLSNCWSESLVGKTTRKNGTEDMSVKLFNRQAKDDQCRDRKDAHRNAH
jgi:hypothetical protein